MNNTLLLQQFDLLATAPGGVARLRELILTLAVQGKLVPQDPADEPAGVLLKMIQAEKDGLIAEGKLKREKPLAEMAEEDQPFELPSGWVWVRLAEIAYPQAGFAFKSSGFNEACQGLPLIRIRDVGGNDPATYFAGDYREEFVVESGDWLISMDGEFRVREWTGPKALLNQRVTRLVFFGGALFQPFVTAALQFKLSELQGTKAYTTVDHLSGGQIASSVVALPPLAEQSRIVTRVEELMRLCDALEAKGQLEAAQHAQLVSTLLGALTASTTPEELADHWQRVAQHFDLLLDRPAAIDALEQTLLQLAVRGLLVPQDPTDEPASALLQKIRAEKDRLIATGQIKRDKPLPPISDEEKPFELPVGWEWVRLDAISEFANGFAFPSGQFSTDATGVGIVKIGDIQDDEVTTNGMSYISQEYAKTIDMSFRVAPGDMLIAMSGATTGKLGFNLTGSHFFLNQRVGKITLYFIDQQYAYSYLRTKVAENLAISAGSAIPNLSTAQIKNIVFPLPPLPEQSRIVTRVTALRRLCADLRQRLAQSQTTQAALAEALIAEVA